MKEIDEAIEAFQSGAKAVNIDKFIEAKQTALAALRTMKWIDMQTINQLSLIQGTMIMDKFQSYLKGASNG